MTLPAHLWQCAWCGRLSSQKSEACRWCGRDIEVEAKR